MEGLHREDLWLTLSLMRTTQIAKCQAGFASVMRRLLESIQDEVRHGFPLQLETPEGAQLGFISRVLILSDHEQLRQSTGTKGSSGKKSCLKCRNVLSLGHSAIPGHCDVQEHDVSKFVRQTQQGVLDIVAYLQSLNTQARLDEAETLLGWNLNTTADSFITSDSLANFVEVEDCYFDGTHGYFSIGLVAQELGLWHAAAREKSEATLEHVRQYYDAWEMAKSFGKKLSEGHFSAKHWRKGQDFRGVADACMTALPLFAQFGEEVLRAEYPDLACSLDSLKALYKVCLCLQGAKDRPASSAASLPSLQRQHALAFAKAYPLKQRPKMHFNLHLPAQINKWGKYLDAFACERKHKAFKNVEENFRKLAAFEKGVLSTLSSNELRKNPTPEPVFSGRQNHQQQLGKSNCFQAPGSCCPTPSSQRKASLLRRLLASFRNTSSRGRLRLSAWLHANTLGGATPLHLYKWSQQLMEARRTQVSASS